MHFFRAFYMKLAALPKRNMLWFLVVVAIIWVAQCCFCQNMLPTDTKEAISWGSQWTWGSYKHPPLAAFCAYVFARLFNYHDIGQYILAQLCLICGTWFIFLQARDFFDERRAAMAALALYFLHYFNPSQMNFNPNYVEIALLPMLTFFFWRALERPAWWRWLVIGVIGALAVLGKYSGGIVLLTLFLLMFTKKAYRRQFLTVGPYVAGVLFLVLMMPHLVWLYQHDFCTLSYVDDSMTRYRENFTLVLEVLGTALYPFAMVIVAFFIASLPRRRWRREVPIQKFPLLWGMALCALPALIFLAIAVQGGTVVAAWFYSLTSWAPIAVMAVWRWHVSRKNFRRFFLVLLAYTLVMVVGTVIDTNCKARFHLHTTPGSLAAAVDPVWHRHAQGPIAAAIGNWETVFMFHLYFPNHPPVAEPEDFLSIENLRPVADQQGVLLIEKAEKKAKIFIQEKCDPGIFVEIEKVVIPYRSRWGKAEQQYLWIAYLPPGALKK